MAVAPALTAADPLAAETSAAAPQQRWHKHLAMHAFKPPAASGDYSSRGLPPGWERRIVMRKSGASAGHHDVYYYK